MKSSGSLRGSTEPQGTPEQKERQLLSLLAEGDFAKERKLPGRLTIQTEEKRKGEESLGETRDHSTKRHLEGPGDPKVRKKKKNSTTPFKTIPETIVYLVPHFLSKKWRGQGGTKGGKKYDF